MESIVDKNDIKFSYKNNYHLEVLDANYCLNRNLGELVRAQTNFLETIRRMLLETIREIRKTRQYVEVGYRG